VGCSLERVSRPPQACSDPGRRIIDTGNDPALSNWSLSIYRLYQHTFSHHRPFRSTLISSVFAAVLVLSACTSSTNATPSANPSTPVTPITSAGSPTDTAASQPTSVPTPPGSSSNSVGGVSPAACLETQLKATVDTTHLPGNETLNSAGKNQVGIYLNFENTSTATCTITGYPGVATVGSNGQQVTQATRTLRGSLGGLPAGQAQFAPVEVVPGAYAQAVLEGVDQKQEGAAQAGCDAQLPSILVTPPNTKIPVPFTVKWGTCYSVDVHPVVPLNTPPS
jgi:hypothetical protein